MAWLRKNWLVVVVFVVIWIGAFGLVHLLVDPVVDPMINQLLFAISAQLTPTAAAIIGGIFLVALFIGVLYLFSGFRRGDPF